MPFPTAQKSLFSTFSVLSPKACPYVMVSFFLWGGVGLEEFGAEGVVVAEVLEVGGGGVGF